VARKPWHSIAPTEADEQKFIFSWAMAQENTYPELTLLHCIPNQRIMFVRDPQRYAHYMFAQGLRKGLPDIHLPVGRGNYLSLYIELKRQCGGRPSGDQLRWLRELQAANNYCAIAHGGEAAVAIISQYLEGKL